MLRHAVMAEKMGFHSIWAGESHQSRLRSGHSPSPLLTLAALSSVTKSLRLGTGVLLLPLYDPLKLAEDTAAVDCLSGGRLALGVALGGEPNREYFNVPEEDLGNRFEEAVRLVRELWREPQVSHSGKHFTYRNVSVTPKPLQEPCPPILIGGGRFAGAARAATLGDGWIGASNHTRARLKVLIARYKASLSKNQQGDVTANRVLYLDRDSSSARQRGLPHFMEFARWYSERGALWDSKGRPIDYKDNSEALIEELALIGSPDDCIEGIERYEKLGVNQLNLRIKLPGMKRGQVENAMRLLSQRVFPHFAER